MSISLPRMLAGITSAALLLATGCGAPAPAPSKPAPIAANEHDHGHDHDHGHGDHHGPATLAEGLTQLEKAVATITTGLSTGAKEAADDAVHEVGHLLGDLETLVAKQEWTAEVKEKGLEAIAELTDSFDKLDQSLHAGDGKGDAPLTVLGSVTERIGKAIMSLGDIIRETSKPAASTTTKEKT